MRPLKTRVKTVFSSMFWSEKAHKFMEIQQKQKMTQLKDRSYVAAVPTERKVSAAFWMNPLIF